MLSQLLLAASAAIILLLGTIHLGYTFATNKFSPRDPALEERLRQVSPRLTHETTMWRAWVGFNASHSLGAMLFGAVYGYLALVQAELLLTSWFLSLLGAVFLASLLLLARRYWFSVPFRGIALASLLYGAGLALAGF